MLFASLVGTMTTIVPAAGSAFEMVSGGENCVPILIEIIIAFMLLRRFQGMLGHDPLVHRS